MAYQTLKADLVRVPCAVCYTPVAWHLSLQPDSLAWVVLRNIYSSRAVLRCISSASVTASKVFTLPEGAHKSKMHSARELAKRIAFGGMSVAGMAMIAAGMASKAHTELQWMLWA
jgi:hypothetical protein